MRRGSALLIVLGMVSFMVISAVGFSIYMRESRAPSSHLRRESTARYLLKSALANAVECLDGQMVDLGTEGFRGMKGQYALKGVYDDVYPGLLRPDDAGGNDQGKDDGNGTTADAIRALGDHWNHRVFTPFGACSVRETVSTLTLEALAYLPPALINEVRVFSRTTRTARWHNLAYDLGRYAFCAIDVSDCFDINKVYASERRTSNPGSRINLSSLYPNNGSALDDLFDRANDVPFVSVADFNVAAGNSAYTPFMRYIGSSGSKIYSSGDAAVLSNALFVTDTWFPETNDYLTAQLDRRTRPGAATRDLMREADQPFSAYTAKHFLEINSLARPLMIYNLGGPGLACLYDYLDKDATPISLALPTVEAAPMVCSVSLLNGAGALNPKFDGKPTSEFTYTRTVGGTAYQIQRTITERRFTGAMDIQQALLTGAAVYPFRRMKTLKRQSGKKFTIEAMLGLFYADAALKARVGQSNTKVAAVFRPDPSSWGQSGPRGGVLWYATESKQLALPDDLCSENHQQNQENALIPFNLQFKNPGAVAPTVCYEIAEKDVTPSQDPPLPPLPAGTLKNGLTLDSLKDDDKSVRPFDADGKAVGFPADQKPELYGAEKLQSGEEQNMTVPPGKYRLQCAVWLRIADENGKTVDMAPATFADDANWLDGAKEIAQVASTAQLTAFCGAGAPLLLFSGDQQTEFAYDAKVLTGLDGTKATQFGAQALYAPDPRYNFAPEDWTASQTVYQGPSDWLDVTKGYLGAAPDRDKDIFLFTSDQEFLQSIGELQFLPYVQELGVGAQFLASCDMSGANYDGVVGSLPNKNRYWTSYSGTADIDSGRNPFFDCTDEGGKTAEIVSGTGGFRVNPYSSDGRVLSAAVLDTPYDYYVASTNKETNPSFAEMSLSTARTLAFGENGVCGDWDPAESAGVATRLRQGFIDAFNEEGITDFTRAMQDRDYFRWDDADRNFLFGDEFKYPLCDVDRKFLFSYWRDCFQNRQQLFLVFLRAEPLTVGGSTGDALANSQLGARGVALVWRDPAPPTTTGGKQAARAPRKDLKSLTAWRSQSQNTGPHRTRVLFYHQFD